MRRAPRRSHRRLGVLLFVLGAAPALHAHDFWIEPASFKIAPGARVAIALKVGHGLEVTPYARNPERIVRFQHVDEEGTRDVAGLPGEHPAGLTLARDAGPAWIVYRSTSSFLSLPAERFEPYLLEEGLERIIELRAARGESKSPGREAYSRCCKALLGRASPDDLAFLRRPIGLELELVPDVDPRVAPADGSLRFRALRSAAPVEGVRVDLAQLHESELGAAISSGRTDDEGRVRLAAPGPGRWLVSAVRMTEAPPGVAADWESLWTTLAFEIPTPPIEAQEAADESVERAGPDDP